MQRNLRKKNKGSVIDAKYMGEEPLLSSDSSPIDVIQFYNWHNYFHSADEAKSFIITYFKSKKVEKSTIQKVLRLDPHDLRTIGWRCRNLYLGGTLPKKEEDEMWDRLSLLVEKLEDVAEETVIEEKPVISIQERIENKISDIIATLEDQVDDFIVDHKSDFDVESYFRNYSIKPVVAKRIADYYKPLYSEIFDALNKNDAQLEEAYDGWDRKSLKAYLDFIKRIVTTAETFAVAVKIERKPRKKKEKPAALVVKKLKYKEKDDETNITSIVPAIIVGSDQLWTYNTKSRTLSVYNALGPVGLSIKGTTVTGYDEKTSITKKLRKPEDVLPKVLDGGKLILRKLMDELTTTAKEANGRINTDTILLRANK